MASYIETLFMKQPSLVQTNVTYSECQGEPNFGLVLPAGAKACSCTDVNTLKKSIIKRYSRMSAKSNLLFEI